MTASLALPPNSLLPDTVTDFSCLHPFDQEMTVYEAPKSHRANTNRHARNR